MKVKELIELLQKYPQTDTVVVVGCSWYGCNEPEFFEAEPDITQYDQKVVIQA